MCGGGGLGGGGGGGGGGCHEGNALRRYEKTLRSWLHLTIFIGVSNLIFFFFFFFLF